MKKQFEERVELSRVIEYAMRDWDDYLEECYETETPPIDSFEDSIADSILGAGYRKQEWIFANSPFEMLDVAFKNLFPGVKYTAYFEPNIRDEPNGDKVLGLTDFGEDGEITIFIDCELTINNAVEIFAHELAHAAVGVEHDHDEVWEKAFDDLFVEYNRIGDEMFSSNINAPKGEDYSTSLKKHLEGDPNDS